MGASIAAASGGARLAASRRNGGARATATAAASAALDLAQLCAGICTPSRASLPGNAVRWGVGNKAAVLLHLVRAIELADATELNVVSAAAPAAASVAGSDADTRQRTYQQTGEPTHPPSILHASSAKDTMESKMHKASDHDLAMAVSMPVPVHKLAPPNVHAIDTDFGSAIRGTYTEGAVIPDSEMQVLRESIDLLRKGCLEVARLWAVEYEAAPRLRASPKPGSSSTPDASDATACLIASILARLGDSRGDETSLVLRRAIDGLDAWTEHSMRARASVAEEVGSRDDNEALGRAALQLTAGIHVLQAVQSWGTIGTSTAEKYRGICCGALAVSVALPILRGSVIIDLPLLRTVLATC